MGPNLTQVPKDRYNADNVVIGGGVALTLSLTLTVAVGIVGLTWTLSLRGGGRVCLLG